MSKNILIGQKSFNTIVQLANKKQEEESGRRSNLPVSFPNVKGHQTTDEMLDEILSPPTNEFTALRQLIERLNPNELRELSAIMCFGRNMKNWRGYFPKSKDVDTENYFAKYRENEVARDLNDIKGSILCKEELGQFLSAGLHELKQKGFSFVS